MDIDTYRALDVGDLVAVRKKVHLSTCDIEAGSCFVVSGCITNNAERYVRIRYHRAFKGNFVALLSDIELLRKVADL